MTYSEKLKLAESLRAGTGLADGIEEDISYAGIRKTRLSQLLPDWRKSQRKVGRKARTK